MAGSLAIAKIVQGTAGASRKSWGRFSGLDAASASPVDVNRPVRSASSLANAWRKAFDGAAQTEASMRAAADKSLEDIAFRIDRTATTETINAWNEETIRQNDIAASRGIVVVETWEAELDNRTCSACEAMAGKSVTRPETFPEAPPIHGNCRCFLTTEYIDREAA